MFFLCPRQVVLNDLRPRIHLFHCVFSLDNSLPTAMTLSMQIDDAWASRKSASLGATTCSVQVRQRKGLK